MRYHVFTIVEQLPTVERSDAAVLLMGETGTDQELCGSGHLLSGKAAYPFVPLNYGPLPDTLPEDELFGHQREAFTDHDKAGATRPHGIRHCIYLDSLTESFLIHTGRSRNVHSGAILAKIAGCDRGHKYFILGSQLARYSFSPDYS